MFNYKIKIHWNKILPKLMAVLTGSPRYIPEFEWSNLWSINAFRVYESIFGRRFGIRAETTSMHYKVDGQWIQVISCWSLESKVAHREVQLREFLKKMFRLPRLEWEYVPLPAFALAGGMPIGNEKLIPYRFAVAYDNSGEEIGAPSTSPFTYSYTVTGSNPALFVQFNATSGSASAVTHYTTGVTYNSASLTQLESTDTGTPTQCFGSELYWLAGCSTGSNTVSCSWSSGSPGGYQGAASYSGVDTTLDAHANGHNYPSSINTTSLVITVVGANCWVLAFSMSGNAKQGAGSGTTMRAVSSDTYNEGWYDSGGTVSAGSYTLNVNLTNGNDNNTVRVGASIAPVSVTFTVSVSDQLNLTDVITIVVIKNISVSDQLNITESISREANNFISVSDQLNVTESISREANNFISVSDQLNVTESISREANNFISVNDQLNITESLTIFINPLLISVSDQLNITESVTTVLFQETLLLSVSDQLNITENIQTELNNYISVNDQLTITESVSTSVQSYISVSDQLNITEAVTPGLVSFINVSDQLNVTESVTKTVSEVARGLVYMRGGDQNLPVTLTKQDYPLGFNDTSVS